MSDHAAEGLENEAVNPLEIDIFNAQDHSVDQLICLTPARLPRSPRYYDERYVAGEQRIGLGDCIICRNAPNNCFLVSYAQGLPSCGHLICSTCATEIMTKGNRTCPFCRQFIHSYILANFP